MLKPSIILSILCVLGCINSNKNAVVNQELPDKNEDEVEAQSEHDTTASYYADSMIAELSKPPETIKIDSFYELHNFDQSQCIFGQCDNFTIEMLHDLDVHGIQDGVKKLNEYSKVSKPQNRILDVTEYLCDKTFSDGFKAYVFHSSKVESHYSNCIKLVTIPNESNDYNSLVLAQYYLSEGYEYDVTSRFVSKNKVEVSKEERFHTSNNSTVDDSTHISITKYQIDENGDIVLLNN